MMTRVAKIVLGFGQEVSFHLLALFFTPRMFHNHGSTVTIGGVGGKR